MRSFAQQTSAAPMLEYHRYGKLPPAYYYPLAFWFMTSSDTSRIAVQQIDPYELKAWIKAQALDLGFADCVIAKPDAQEQMPRF